MAAETTSQTPRRARYTPQHLVVGTPTSGANGMPGVPPGDLDVDLPYPETPHAEQLNPSPELTAERLDTEQLNAERVSVDDDPHDFYRRLFLAEKQRPRSVTLVPKLIGQAVVLVWNTSRVQTLGISALQVTSAGVAALQVLIAGYAAREVLELKPGQGRSVSHLLLPLILLAVFVLIASIMSGGQSQLGQLLGVRVEKKVSQNVLDVSANVELITYDDADFYEQLSRVVANVPTRPFAVVSCLASTLGGVAGVVALGISVLVLNPLLLPVVLVSAVPLWYLSRRTGRLEWDFALAQTTGLRERQYLTDVLTERAPAAELRAYKSAGRLRARYDELYDDYIEATRIKIRRRYKLRILSGVSVGAVTILTIVLIVALVEHGTVGISAAAASAVAIRLLGSRIQQLFGGISTLFESSLFLEDFAEFMARDPSAQEPVAALTGSPAPRPFRGVELDSVDFTYPNSDVRALADITLRIKPGETVALVGENGSGKTTLAKILAGLYEPTGGTLRWNDTEVRDRVQQERVRDQVSLVLQDFLHYAMTAEQNIAFGRPELPISRDRVRAAAARVGADTFLEQLPIGYETRLSRMFEGGRELSLGQWQRVALSRVFYRNAPVIILDEPTAALDPRAEYQLYESMRQVLSGRTVVLITHRMNSVRNADRILVLSRGALVEEGTHQQLMTDNGLYAELVTLQSAGGIGSAAREQPPTAGSA